MKAVFVKAFGLENPLAVEEAPDPKPGTGQVLVRVRAAGVNPLEVSIRSGKHPRAKMMKLPYICGTDVAGEVEAVGEGVKDFKAGDRVWGRSEGAYAERALVPVGQTGRLPDAIPFAEGASLAIPLLTAWNAVVIKGEAGPGDVVLVQGGAGGVGHMAIQLARQMGCRVFATASTKEKADLCLRLGAEAAIRYKEEDLASRVMALTGGRGVDVIVETTASDNLGQDVNLVAVNGRIVLVGTGTGKGPEGSFNVAAALGRDARLIALSAANLAPHLPEAMRRLGHMLAAGAIRAHVGKELPLAKAEEAHRILLSGGFLGKIVLVP